MNGTVPSFAGVVGAGAWGTALAGVLAAAGVPRVAVWVRDPAAREAIRRDRVAPALPGTALAPAIEAVDTLGEAASAPLVLMAVPAQASRAVLRGMVEDGARPGILVLVAKGVERGTGRLQTAIAEEFFPSVPAVALSGPSFAVDVAAGLPTAVTLAARDVTAAETAARAFATEAFRPYASADPAGVEVGGALKNVYAIAAGIVIGAGLGESARAALIARSIAELTRLAVAMGGRAETVAGLSGLGDLVLTATSEKSRNFSYGLACGRAGSAEAVRREREAAGHPPLVEGAATAGAAVELADGLGVDVPVAEAVADVLSGAATIGAVTARLLRRPLKREG